MRYSYQGVNVYYKLIGSNINCTILLHGWGCDSTIFDGLISLMPNHNFLILDFPPFGLSQIEPKNWNIYSYANMVISLCEHLGIRDANVVGHSFGGRVAILLSALKPSIISKLILVDSAGIRPKRNIKYYLKVYSYKLLRSFGFVFSNAGSIDYQNLSSDMKKVFIAVVNQDLKAYLPLIKQKTLIIFGEKDKETPIYMAKKLHKLINNSQLEIMKGAGHFCFLENLLTFYKLIDKFLEA